MRVGMAVAALVVALLPAPTTGQVPRFESRVEVVKLSVLVRGPSGPMLGLAANDFDVRDNGVAQEVDRVLTEELPLNVILAFDASGSVRGEKLNQLKRASRSLLDGLRPGDRAALLTFADVLSLRLPLGEDLESLRACIDGLTAEGGTALMDGSFAATVLGDAIAGRVMAVVFTDGQETVSWLPEGEVLDAAKRSEVVMYGVRVGAEAPRFLGRVASATGGRVLHVASADGLRGAFLEVLAEFRSRYLLSYTPRGVARKGWHRLDVRVKGRPAKVLVRKGYLVTR